MRQLTTIGVAAILLAGLALAGTPSQIAKKEAKTEKVMTDQAAGNYKVVPFKTIDGETTNLSAFDGKVVLIVNVASKCGYTKQYTGLEALYDKYKEQGVVVVGFPANNFGGQEPGTDEEIKEFCSTKFDVSFPMMSKVSVKGDDIHPLFKYLTESSGIPGEIGWNFGKFLIDQHGNLVARWPSKVEPTGDEITGKIEELLKSNKVEKKS